MHGLNNNNRNNIGGNARDRYSANMGDTQNQFERIATPAGSIKSGGGEAQ